jgi:hypothetical protein
LDNLACYCQDYEIYTAVHFAKLTGKAETEHCQLNSFKEITSLLYKKKNSKVDSVKTPQKCHTHLRTSSEIPIIQIGHALLAKRWKPDPVGTRQAEEDFFGAACLVTVLVEAAYPNWTAWKTTFEDDDTSNTSCCADEEEAGKNYHHDEHPFHVFQIG